MINQMLNSAKVEILVSMQITIPFKVVKARKILSTIFCTVAWVTTGADQARVGTRTSGSECAQLVHLSQVTDSILVPPQLAYCPPIAEIRAT